MKCDIKTIGDCLFEPVPELGSASWNTRATRGCRWSRTEFEPAAVDQTIVKIGTFAIANRLLACRWPWLLTAIGERKFADVKPYEVLSNKQSNNLGAAPGN